MSEKLQFLLIDRLLIGLILALVAYWFGHQLERHRGQLAWFNEMMRYRLDCCRRLATRLDTLRGEVIKLHALTKLVRVHDDSDVLRMMRDEAIKLYDIAAEQLYPDAEMKLVLSDEVQQAVTNTGDALQRLVDRARDEEPQTSQEAATRALLRMIEDVDAAVAGALTALRRECRVDGEKRWLRLLR